MATCSSPSVNITPYRFNISTGFSKPLSPPKSTPLPAATTVIDITRDSDSDIPPLIPGTHTQTPAGVPGSITCVPVQPRKRSREIRSPGGSPTSAAEYLSSAASTSSFAFPLIPGGGDSTASSSAKRRPTKTQKVDNSSHVLDMGRREHHQHQQRQQRQRNHCRSLSSSSRPSTTSTTSMSSSSSLSFEHSHTSSTPAAPRRLKRENAIIFPNTGSSATSNATATSSSGTRTTAGSSSSRTPTPSTSMPSASTSTSTSTYAYEEYPIPSPTWMETYMRSRFGGDSDFLFMDIDTSPCVPQADVEVDGDADTEMEVDVDSGSSVQTSPLSYVREQRADAQHRGRQRNKHTETRTENETRVIQLHTMTTCPKTRRKITKERWNAERARVEKVRLEELKRLREEEERMRKEAEEKEVEEKARMEKMKEALKDKKEAAKYRDEMMARAARAREERMKQEQQQQQQQEGGGAFDLGTCMPDQIQASTAPRSLRRSYALYGANEFTSGSSKIMDAQPLRTRTRVHSTSFRPRQPSPPPLSNVPITLVTRGRQPRAQSSSSPPAERFLYDFPVATPSPSPPPPPPPTVQFQSKRSPLVPDELRESARHVIPDDVLPEAVREWKRMTPRIPSGTVPSSYSTKVVVYESERKSRCEERNGGGVSSLEDEKAGLKKKVKVESSNKKKKAVSETRRAAMVWAVESLFGRKEWLRMCVEAEEKENEGVKVQQLTKKAAVKPKKSRPEPEALTPLWKCKQVFRVGPRAAFLHQVVEWEMLFAGVDGGGADREEREREMFGNGADRSPQEVPTAVGGTPVPGGEPVKAMGAAATSSVMDATRELEMLVDDIERAQDELEIDDDVDVEMAELEEGDVSEMLGVAEASGLELGGEDARDSGLQLELERELGLACEDEIAFGMLGGERDAPGEVDDSFVVVLSSLSASVSLPSSGVSSESRAVSIAVTSTSSSSSSSRRSGSPSKSACYISPSSLLSVVSPRSPPAPLSCSPPGKSKAAMPVMTMTPPAWVVVAKDRTGMDGGTLEGEVKSPVPVHKGAASGSSAGVTAKPAEKEANRGSMMKTGGKFGLGLGLGLSFGGGGGGGRVRRPGSAWRATRSEKEDVVFGTSGTGSSASWEMVY